MKQPTQLKDTLLVHKDVLKSVFIFLALCFIFDFLYFGLAGDQILQRTFTAALVAVLLKAFGLNAEANGTLVQTDGVSLDIIGECTGIFPIIIFTACVLAYPTSLRNKAIGLLGIPVLYALTLVRLIVTALVGVFTPALLEFFHAYLWQAFHIVFVILLFLIWRDKVVERETR